MRLPGACSIPIPCGVRWLGLLDPRQAATPTVKPSSPDSHRADGTHLPQRRRPRWVVALVVLSHWCVACWGWDRLKVAPAGPVAYDEPGVPQLRHVQNRLHSGNCRIAVRYPHSPPARISDRFLGTAGSCRSSEGSGSALEGLNDAAVTGACLQLQGYANLNPLKPLDDCVEAWCHRGVMRGCVLRRARRFRRTALRSSLELNPLA